MAIVLAFPVTGMFKILVEDGRDDSFYMDLASKLVHFIFAQTLSLIAAIMFGASSFIFVNFVGFLLMTYALLAGALVAVSLYGVARFYNHPGA